MTITAVFQSVSIKCKPAILWFTLGVFFRWPVVAFKVALK